ncbi:CGNR zinc finger domain-containing protein [Streptoalloteichus tenebrarius]|uniref:CGNR zinc finger domain-containing protein n=1 Tax=Streptoalloteichus tenebrarius (strain ATCC 17920 / DSM 40477 / JCM 4838 / CBS 697.72 / NBRC 16177 / NCIMB 11028 / NRRL B-12390 / A12253. 1 / ISP 5477) TaxID=1933 RepID=A0ABT1HQY7_STRSD|nr:CGNR zinc finger domain-containing protein [Streptoalloteichus tenebrarius]MCP2257939.1 CGNR zinc finger domain-containing protein [Streptoalloteichus tenebrarius]BFF01602.1 hypothetical protein GCM10020241_32770 [Streptoalloteichus tenebrarius]
MGGGARRWTAPPFRELDPGLADAESLMASGGGGLADVVAALPDELLAARRLNAVLARVGAAPRLCQEGARWRVVVVGDGDAGSRVAVAAGALALLVSATGWQRVKRCAAPGCAAAFVDRTNGRSRRRCAAHARGTGGRRGVSGGA